MSFRLVALFVLAASTQALAGAPSASTVAKADAQVAAVAKRSLSAFTGTVAYAGTANHGKDLRVVAYRRAPGAPTAYLFSMATQRVRRDAVNPPSMATLNKAAKRILAGK